MNFRTSAAVAAAALLACGAAAAQFKSPDDAIEYRQGALAVMGHHFGQLGAMANGKIPYDAAAAKADAELVATLSRLPWSAFVEGSDKGETSARPEIWSQRDKFNADARKLQDAVARLLEAARTGKPDALKAAFGPTAQACKSCHDDFRRKH
jgi:cytochrome c556